MSGLSGQVEAPAADSSMSLADQAYSKFATMSNFELVSKKDTKRENPFEMTSTSVGASLSLADMKASASASQPKKEIMKSPTTAVQNGEMASGQQQQQQQASYWGGQAGAYAASQPGYGVAQPGYGAPPQPQYGQQQPPMQQQQQQFGQQFQQPGYGASPYQQGY
jgi:hypothetical protein